MIVDAEHDVLVNRLGASVRTKGVPRRIDAGQLRRPSVSQRLLARGGTTGGIQRRHGVVDQKWSRRTRVVVVVLSNHSV